MELYQTVTINITNDGLIDKNFIPIDGPIWHTVRTTNKGDYMYIAFCASKNCFQLCSKKNQVHELLLDDATYQEAKTYLDLIS